jgi:hypothetical protein
MSCSCIDHRCFKTTVRTTEELRDHRVRGQHSSTSANSTHDRHNSERTDVLH